MWGHSPARSKVSEEAISASRLILDCRQNCGKLSHWLEAPSLCILPYKILTKLEPKRLLPPPSVTFMRKYALARPARLSSFWAETTQHWAITIFFFISDKNQTSFETSTWCPWSFTQQLCLSWTTRGLVLLLFTPQIVFFVSWEIAGNSERDLNFGSVEWKELWRQSGLALLFISL